MTSPGPMPYAGPARVLSNLPLGPIDHLIAFQLPRGLERGGPGQFWQLRRGENADPLLGRPMSIFDLPAAVPESVEVLVRTYGKGSRELAQLRPGERMFAVGPLGKPYRPVPAAARHVLVAGGVGIGPFPLLARACKPHGEVVLLAGAAKELELVGLDRFEELGVAVRAATDDGSVGHHGYVTELLDEELIVGVAVYACGPGPMLEAVARACAARSLPCQVSLEQRMACGVGICFGCVARLETDEGPRNRRTCLDGPVVEAGRVSEWRE